MKQSLTISNLHKSHGATHIIRGASLSVAQGDVVAITGSSGSGKTTLLRCINALDAFEQGTIYAAGHTVLPHTSKHGGNELRKKVGMVFQEYELWPHKTVIENITLAPVLHGKMPNTAHKQAMQLLTEVGLEAYGDRYPHELSGGQKQRIALARALALEPEVLLLDEITSALDPRATHEILTLLRALAQTHQCTFVVVSHEESFVREVADHVYQLSNGTLTKAD